MVKQLIIIRHAIAEDPTTDKSDSERVLTLKGIERMKRAAKGLKKICPEIQAVVTSPYSRATATAEIIASTYGLKDILTTSYLEPGKDRTALLRKLNQLPYESIAIIGHQPDLGLFANLLINGNLYSPFNLKKGGMIMISVQDGLMRASSELQWFMSPKQLRMLAR